MQLSLNISEQISKKLFEIHKSNDLETIVWNLIQNEINRKSENVTLFFNKVDYVEGYDYKASRNKNESTC